MLNKPAIREPKIWDQAASKRPETRSSVLQVREYHNKLPGVGESEDRPSNGSSENNDQAQ